MSRILVTGGAGFIGSHVVEALLDSGSIVVVVDNLSTGKSRNLPDGVPLHVADVADEEAARLVETFRPHCVVHLAAQASVGVSTKDPVLDCRTNVLGTVRMLDAAHRCGCGRFVFASSAAVYGVPGQIPVSEDHPVGPLSFYGLSKASAERYVREYSRRGIDCAILRYANVYGPRQDTQGEAGVVAVFVDLLVRGGRPVIHGDGTQSRDFVYVKDVAAATASVALRGSGGAGTLNIGTGRETTVNRLLEMAAAACGRRVEPLYGERREGDIHRSVLDVSGAGENLGWKAGWSLDDGLRETVLWYSGSGR